VGVDFDQIKSVLIRYADMIGDECEPDALQSAILPDGARGISSQAISIEFSRHEKSVHSATLHDDANS